MKAHSVGCTVLLCLLSLPNPLRAYDERQLLIATSYAATIPENDRIFRMPLEGGDAYQLIEFAGPGDGLGAPYVLDVNPSTGRLYVGNNDTGEILEIEINSDGTKGAVRVFGTFPIGFTSMAIRPSTGRIYIGVQGGSKERRGIYRMAADGSGYEKIHQEPPGEDYFFDNCWIDFNPADDSLVYAATGFRNRIYTFDANDGSYNGYMQSYEDVAWDYDVPDEYGYYHAIQFFVPVGGGAYDLFASVHWMPGGSWRFLLDFDPVTDTFIGEIPAGGPTLTFPPPIGEFVHDAVSGRLYAGTGSGGKVYEVLADYSSYNELHDFQMDAYGHTRVEISYGHSAGADTDDDGLTDDDETGVFGTDPYDSDSDTDGYLDAEEIAHDGSPGTYDAGTDTDPLDADSDGDGFSDMVEINGGSDPLTEGWTAGAMLIKVSFQPPASPRPSGYAPDSSRSYTVSRGYGW